MVNQEKLLVYPKPGNGNFHILGIVVGAEYQFLKSDGTVVMDGKFSQDGIINLGSKSTGIYYLKTKTNNNNRIFKLIVK